MTEFLSLEQSKLAYLHNQLMTTKDKIEASIIKTTIRAKCDTLKGLLSSSIPIETKAVVHQIIAPYDVL